jgi:Protein of unknown function (DUF3987)
MIEMQSFLRKLPEQAARIAALFHYFDRKDDIFFSNSEAIDGQAVRGAIRLCDWFMHEYKGRFTEDGSARRKEVESVADVVHEKIVANHHQAISRGLWSAPPVVDKNGQVSKVQAGRLFSWDGNRN